MAYQRGTIARWPFFVFIELELYIYSDLITVGNHWKSLAMCLDSSPTWLQTQRQRAPLNPFPAVLEIWIRKIDSAAFLHYLVLIWTKHCQAIGPPPKKTITDNLYFRTEHQQFILTAAHVCLLHQLWFQRLFHIVLVVYSLSLCFPNPQTIWNHVHSFIQ